MKLQLILGLALSMLSCQATPDKSPSRQSISSTSNTTDMAAISDSLERYLSQLGSEHGHDRQEAIQWLVANAGESRTALRSLISRPETDSWRRSGALEALGSIGNPEDVDFLKSTATAHPQNQWEAMEALAHHSAPTAFQVLEEFAESDLEELAADALVALGIRKDEQARALLESKAVNGTDKIRWKAVHALSLLGIEPSRALLQQQLKVEKDQSVLEKIVSTLSKKP